MSVGIGIFESCMNLNYLSIIFVRDGIAELVSSVFGSHSFAFATTLPRELRFINHSQGT